MDLVATMNELGVDKSAHKVLGLLPLVYVAWADGKVQRAERESILHAASEMGWLEGGGDAVLERWLSAPPTEAQLRAGIAILNHLGKDQAGDVDADDLHMLLLLCKDVAEAAGGLFGLGGAQSTKEISALETIAEALDIKNAKGWRALQSTH